MANKIIVTPRSVSAGGHPALQKLVEAGYELVFPSPGRVPTLEEQIEALDGCVGYLAGVEAIGREVLEIAHDLRAISRNGTGADSIDITFANSRNIQVLRAPAANAQGVAELTLALMFASARHLPFAVNSIARGDWERRQGVELNGRTLGLVGCGQIGQRVARVALSIGMKVSAFDAFPDTSFSPGDLFEFKPFDEVVESADFLSLHCPPTTEPLINKNTIQKMKDGAFLVNTARSSLVAEDQIITALDSGKLLCYAADVYDFEPPGMTALTQHPKFIGTAHIGGFTAESVDRAMHSAVDNLLKALYSSHGEKYR
jgi:D-3-phosphoglycerate dehydrogenase